MKHQKNELEQALIDSWDELVKPQEEQEQQNKHKGKEITNTEHDGSFSENMADEISVEDMGDPVKENEKKKNHIQAPEHWPAADRAAFAELPHEMQQFLLRRSKETDADYTRKTQELAEQRKTLAPIKSVTDAWGEYFNQIGVDPATAINHVMQVEKTLRNGTPEQKRQVIAQLVRDYGVHSPPMATEHVVHATAPGTHDQNVATLQQQLNSLQEQLQVNHQQQAQAQQEQLVRLAEFAAQTDEAGNLRHPHFLNVQNTMLTLMQNGQAQTLADAYDMAVWANPELRRQMLSAHEAQQMAERSKSASRAKKAARANVRGSGVPTRAAQPKSLEEELKQVWQELSGQS